MLTTEGAASLRWIRPERRLPFGVARATAVLGRLEGSIGELKPSWTRPIMLETVPAGDCEMTDKPGKALEEKIVPAEPEDAPLPPATVVWPLKVLLGEYMAM